MNPAVAARIRRTFGAHTFGNFVTALDRLLTVPLFLHAWGLAVFGEWLLLRTIPAYLALAEFGFASVAGNAMARSVATREYSAANESYQSAWAISLIVSIGLLIIVSCGAIYLPIGKWLGISSIPHEALVAAIVALTIYVLLCFQTQLINAGFRAEGHHATGVVGTHAIRIGELIAICVALLLGGTVVALAACYVLVRFIGNLLLAAALLRKSPWIRVGLGLAKWPVIRHTWGRGMSFAAVPFAMSLNLQGSILLIGRTLGAESVAVFGVVRLVCNAIVQYGAQIGRTAWPEFTMARARRDEQLMRLLHRKAIRFAIWGSSVIGMLLIVFGNRLISIWTGGSIAPSTELVALMVAVVIANSVWYASFSVLLAVDKHAGVASTFLAVTIGTLVVMHCVLTDYGLVGAAMTLAVGELVMICSVIPRVLRDLGDHPREFLRSLITSRRRSGDSS